MVGRFLYNNFYNCKCEYFIITSSERQTHTIRYIDNQSGSHCFRNWQLKKVFVKLCIFIFYIPITHVNML